MTAHKRYNKDKTKFTWAYWLSVPSNEFDINGKPKRIQLTKSGFSTKKEALKAEKECFEQIKNKSIELNKNLCFKNIIDFYIEYTKNEGQYAKGTIANYITLNRMYFNQFSNIKVDKLAPVIIKNWQRNVIKNISPYRYNDCIKLLKAAFNYAKKEKLITSNPFSNLSKKALPKKLRKRFSIAQLKNMLENCKQTMPEYYCLFALATLTGMRVGEYSALTKSDIDFENKRIFVDKQFTRNELKARNKTLESTRIVDISDNVLNILKWHIDTFNIEDELFLSSANKIVSNKWVNRKFAKLLEINNFPQKYCRVHDLRGQYVDIMHVCGIPTEYISRQVGHSSTVITSNIYTQILDAIPIEASIRMDKKVFS